MERAKRLFTEAERQRDRDALLATRAEAVAQFDAQLAELDSTPATVEEWEVRYMSITDPVGRVDHGFAFREEAGARADRGNDSACFGHWEVTPRLVGEIATAARVRQ